MDLLEDDDEFEEFEIDQGMYLPRWSLSLLRCGYVLAITGRFDIVPCLRWDVDLGEEICGWCETRGGDCITLLTLLFKIS
jgi:hypothetical protein